ncbi:hypothetical protein ABFG93_20935 [Pseudalkalibacillus hwajinpoensis]|uniref:hypothetical protein n=1 Tax=Guptibacillus hwajinpoensis TaxID=208199 RepID=UPI00325BAFB1
MVNDQCPFCHPQMDSKQHIIFENAPCYFLQHDKEQDVLEGSGLIVPKEHHGNAFELTIEEWNDTYAGKGFRYWLKQSDNRRIEKGDR